MQYFLGKKWTKKNTDILAEMGIWRYFCENLMIFSQDLSNISILNNFNILCQFLFLNYLFFVRFTTNILIKTQNLKNLPTCSKKLPRMDLQQWPSIWNKVFESARDTLLCVQLPKDKNLEINISMQRKKYRTLNTDNI